MCSYNFVSSRQMAWHNKVIIIVVFFFFLGLIFTLMGAMSTVLQSAKT